jgi:hypothetical protein
MTAACRSGLVTGNPVRYAAGMITATGSDPARILGDPANFLHALAEWRMTAFDPKLPLMS